MCVGWVDRSGCLSVSEYFRMPRLHRRVFILGNAQLMAPFARHPCGHHLAYVSVHVLLKLCQRESCAGMGVSPQVYRWRVHHSSQ